MRSGRCSPRPLCKPVRLHLIRRPCGSSPTKTARHGRRLHRARPRPTDHPGPVRALRDDRQTEPERACATSSTAGTGPTYRSPARPWRPATGDGESAPSRCWTPPPTWASHPPRRCCSSSATPSAPRSKRSRTDKEVTVHTAVAVLGITSLSARQATPEHLATYARGHWAIEHKPHRVRDVTFREDASQVKTAAQPRIMVTLRNLTIGLNLTSRPHQNRRHRQTNPTQPTPAPDHPRPAPTPQTTT